MTSLLRHLVLVLLLLAAPGANASWAKPLRFALVVPHATAEQYQPARQGCRDAAAELGGIECLYVGPSQFDPEAQDAFINGLLDQGLDGLAVAVGDSDLLASGSVALARGQGIPVVTFGTDFSPATLAAHPGLRAVFIGTNPRDFGYRLGAQARRFRPGGGTLCVIAGTEDDPGQDLLIDGVNESLLGFDPQRWQIARDCPLYCGGDPDKALKQLLRLVENSGTSDTADTIVVVGGWPQQVDEDYLREMQRLQSRLEPSRMVIVVGGTCRAQLRLLGLGLAHGNVGEDAYAMGRNAVRMLHAIKTGQNVPSVVHTPITTCSGGLAPHSVLCTH